MNYSSLFPSFTYPAGTVHGLLFSAGHAPMNPIRDSMNSLADCLRADSWLTASTSIDDPGQLPKNVLVSLPPDNALSDKVENFSEYMDSFCDALLAEREERKSWERNRIENRRYFATYELREEPGHPLLAYYTSAEGLLRGTVFFSRSPFTPENLQAFGVLFDSVAVGEGNKKLLVDS